MSRYLYDDTSHYGSSAGRGRSYDAFDHAHDYGFDSMHSEFVVALEKFEDFGLDGSRTTYRVSERHPEVSGSRPSYRVKERRPEIYDDVGPNYHTVELRPEESYSSSSAGESRPFRMRRTDNKSSSLESGSYHSQHTPSSHEGRGFRTTARVPAWAPGAIRSPPPARTSRHDGNSTNHSASAFRYEQRSPSRPPRRHSPVRPHHRHASPPPSSRRHRSPSPAPKHRHHSTAQTQAGTKSSKSRRRSPSPPPQRRASALPRGDSRAGGKESAGTFRKTSTAGHYDSGRSHATYGGDYTYSGHSSGRAAGTTSGQRDGSKQQTGRGASPPPRPRASSHAKSSTDGRSHSRSKQTAAPTGPAAVPARSSSQLKNIFEIYSASWEARGRTDKSYPLPKPTSDLYKLGFAGAHNIARGNWSGEDIFVANVQILFLAGFGINSRIEHHEDDLTIGIIDKESHGSELKDLARWLRRKEQPRWHPDRINLRTGQEGKIDENISKKVDVVAMRTAAQQLIALIEK